MKTVRIHKAQAIGDKVAPDTAIIIEGEIPDDDTYHRDWKQALEIRFGAQAAELELALNSALPGGTYDRLLGLMLQRKASYFIVSHDS